MLFVPEASIDAKTGLLDTEMVLVLNINNNETQFVLHLSLFRFVPIKHTCEKRLLTQEEGKYISLGYFYEAPAGCS